MSSSGNLHDGLMAFRLKLPFLDETDGNLSQSWRIGEMDFVAFELSDVDAHSKLILIYNNNAANE